MYHPKMMSQHLQDTQGSGPILFVLYHLFRFACPFLFWDRRTLSASTATPCSLTLLISLTPLLFFLLSHCRRFLEDDSWFEFSLSTQVIPPSTVLPPSLFLQHCYNSITRDEEQGTKGEFSGPLRGPLSLLSDLSPSLVYILVHRHRWQKSVETKCTSFIPHTNRSTRVLF